MKYISNCIFTLIAILAFQLSTAQAAVVHFYSYPEVTKSIFHVNLEYKGYIYDADTRVGGVRILAAYYDKKSDLQVEIPDSLVNEQGLESQLGLPFDFKFEWNRPKTYCSKMVGIALDMTPLPMDFTGTHYLIYYPEWIHRNDPGLSPEHVLEFSLLHATAVNGALRN